jgi:hypothetical protein
MLVLDFCSKRENSKTDKIVSFLSIGEECPLSSKIYGVIVVAYRMFWTPSRTITGAHCPHGMQRLEIADCGNRV